jgi:hypothetical protein
MRNEMIVTKGCKLPTDMFQLAAIRIGNRIECHTTEVHSELNLTEA